MSDVSLTEHGILLTAAIRAHRVMYKVSDILSIVLAGNLGLPSAPRIQLYGKGPASWPDREPCDSPRRDLYEGCGTPPGTGAPIVAGDWRASNPSQTRIANSGIMDAFGDENSQ